MTAQALNTCPLFVELCAGLASVSLRLQGGPYCRPPVSRMGNKAGYAGAILEVLGLRSGQGAGAYLWCEPDDGCRALLQAYPQPDILREAAEIIRSWADEDPRELWERLRGEGPIRGAEGGEVARHLVVNGWALFGQWRGPGANEHGRGNITGEGIAARLDAAPLWPPTATTPDARTVDPSEVARWARIVTSNRLINLDPETWRNTGQGGSTHGGQEFSTDAEVLARGLEGVSGREVARWSLVTGQSVQKWTMKGSWFTRPETGEGQLATATYGDRLDASATSWPPVTITADARDLDPGTLPEGTVVYIDPPYVGTTGYGSDLDRSEVLTLARRWSDAGAVVCISETEQLPELDGWFAVEITHARKGQKRTFSTVKGRTEWLTLNRKPCWVPLRNLDLFDRLSTEAAK